MRRATKRQWPALWSVHTKSLSARPSLPKARPRKKLNDLLHFAPSTLLLDQLNMRRVSTFLPEDQVKRLDFEAKQAGKQRSELIRDRLLAKQGNFPNPGTITTYDFHQTVAKIRRRHHSNLDRVQTEVLVAAVLVEFQKLTQRDQKN